MNTSKSYVTRARLLAVIGCLFVILAFVIFWHLAGSSSPTPQSPVAGTSSDHSQEFPPAVTASDDADAGRELLRSNDGATQTDASVAEQSDTDQPATVQSRQRNTIVVQLVDGRDVPVEGLRVMYGFTEDLDSAVHRVVDRESLQHRATSDAEGLITIADVSPMSGVLFYLDEPRWVPTGATDTFALYVMPSGGWSLRPAVLRQFVTVQEAGTVLLHVRYEDGTPVTGTVGYSVWMKETPDALQETGFGRDPIELVNDVVMVIENLPPEGRLWGNIASQRPGFALRTVFDFRIEAGHEQHVVIPRDESPRWGIEIDLSALAPNEVVHVTTVSADGGRIQDFHQVGPGVIRTTNFAGFATSVNVLVLGERTWQSGLLQLSPGEWKRVVAVPEDACVARLRVVDRHGEPIHPAVAIYDSRGYVNWQRPQAYARSTVSGGMGRAQFASAGQDGRITYTGLPSGHVVLAVEALGYLRRTVEFNFSPGATLDYGDLVLEEATDENSGSIRVTLEGIEEPERHVLLLFSYAPVPAQIRREVAFSPEGVASFSQLDLRNYRITVVRKSGEMGVPDELITHGVIRALSPENTSIEIQVGPDTPELFEVND
jgi:hypothetical protein